MPIAPRAILASAACALAMGSLCPSSARACPVSVGLEVGVAEPATARALAASLAARGLDRAGSTWLGRSDAVGGGRRDVLVHVPSHLDATRPIEVVLMMEGYGSFAPDRLDGRHGAAIATLAERRANAVYVAPDAPSSTHGTRTHRGPYWQAGCVGARACRGGHAAPGDLVAFLTEVHARVTAATCATSPRFTLALVGFSAGGRGVHDAVAQLARAEGAWALPNVGLSQLVYADALYGAWWLDRAWAHVAALPSLREVTLLVPEGSLRRGEGNRARAWAFARRLGATAPSETGDVVIGAVRLVRVPGDHHALGDAAIGWVRSPGAV